MNRPRLVMVRALSGALADLTLAYLVDLAVTVQASRTRS